MARFVAIAILAAAAGAAAEPPPRSAALVAAGRASFNVNCAACHGTSGEGNGPVAFAVKPHPRNLRKDRLVQGDTVEQLFATITHGLPSGTMASYAQLPEAERWALAYYVRTFRK